ncbi:MAG: hypothetical protein ABL949_08830 [Fimbriimonadaceae bacterium]
MNIQGRVIYRRIGILRRIARIPVRLRLAWRDWVEAREESSVSNVPTARERQETLIEFYGHYESLVEILCDAANYAPTPALESKYLKERDWMHTNYDSVRPFAIAYLRFDVNDASQTMELEGSYGDAFEALFAAPSLIAFLAADDGHMICRINRTREALNLCGEHLRQLVAAEKCA